MIALPNGCRCSELSVHPQNWQSAKAKTDSPWYINYWFYPAEGGRKQVSVRGMNHLTELKSRRQATERLLLDEIADLRRGYNPILKNRKNLEAEYIIDPLTPFAEALQLAFDRMNVPKNTRANIKSMLNVVVPYLKNMPFYYTPVRDIKRRHVKQLLEKVEAERELSACNFNHYRAYLMMIFNELISVDTIEINPVDKQLKKREETEKIKIVLDEEQRKVVDTHLRLKYYTFWRYLHIFFHSGARTAELFRVKGEDVDLKRQRYKVIVKKKQKPVEVWKTIKNIALPLWEEIMKDCKPHQYLFGRGLKPADTSIRPDQISKRWLKHVKGTEKGKRKFTGLGIKADFYSLKHLNTAEIVDALNEQDAAKLNSHDGTGMVVKIYDTKQSQRQHERLKKINNKFA